MFKRLANFLLLLILLSYSINAIPQQFKSDSLDSYDAESDEIQSSSNLTDTSGKIFFGWLYDYLWEDEDEDEEQYIICRNCTVNIVPSLNLSVATPTRSTTERITRSTTPSTPLSTTQSAMPSTTSVTTQSTTMSSMGPSPLRRL